MRWRRSRHLTRQMSHGLNSLNGDYEGDNIGEYHRAIGLINGIVHIGGRAIAFVLFSSATSTNEMRL